MPYSGTWRKTGFWETSILQSLAQPEVSDITDFSGPLFARHPGERVTKWLILEALLELG